MKKMTCAQMGGPADCHYECSGATAKELVDSGMAHVMSTHADVAAQIAKMTDAEQGAWFADFQKKFDAAPTVV
jgi:predicted small metal-binding protein